MGRGGGDRAASRIADIVSLLAPQTPTGRHRPPARLRPCPSNQPLVRRPRSSQRAKNKNDHRYTFFKDYALKRSEGHIEPEMSLKR